MKEFIKEYNEGREKRLKGTPTRGVSEAPGAKKSIEHRSSYHKVLGEKKDAMQKVLNKKKQ